MASVLYILHSKLTICVCYMRCLNIYQCLLTSPSIGGVAVVLFSQSAHARHHHFSSARRSLYRFFATCC